MVYVWVTFNQITIHEIFFLFATASRHVARSTGGVPVRRKWLTRFLPRGLVRYTHQPLFLRSTYLSFYKSLHSTNYVLLFDTLAKEVCVFEFCMNQLTHFFTNKFSVMTTIIVEIGKPQKPKPWLDFDEFLDLILGDLEGCTGDPETCEREDCPKKKTKETVEQAWA